MFQFFYILLRFGKLLFEHFTHFFVFFFLQHHKTVLDGFFVLFIFTIGIYDRLQIALLLHQLLKMFLIICNARFSQLIEHFFETNEQII